MSSRPTTRAAAHDRDAVAQLLDLLQLVRHEDHHQPVGGEAAEDVEQLVALGRGDPRRRLVEDEQPGAEPEQAGDLQLLALADRQRAGDGVGVEREAVALRPRRRAARARRLRSRRAPPGLASRKLSSTVNGTNTRGSWWSIPMPAAMASRGDASASARAVELDLAGIGADEPGQHLHQRRLAGAVLAEQAVQLAGGDVEVDAVVGAQRPVASW